MVTHRNTVLQRLNEREQRSDYLHNSAFGHAQSGANIGSTSLQSFSERQAIEQNRRMIRGYRNAKVAQGVNHMPHAATYQDRQSQLAEKIADEIASSIEEKYSSLTRDSSSLSSSLGFSGGAISSEWRNAASGVQPKK